METPRKQAKAPAATDRSNVGSKLPYEPVRPGQRWRPALVTVAVLLFLAILAVVAEWARKRAAGERSQWPAEADTRYLPPARALQLASLGHHELAADLVAARTNVYFGQQMEAKGDQVWLADYLNTVVDLDPHFEPIYLRGAAMLTYSRGEVKPGGVLASAALIRRGLQTFPNSWELHFQLGFNLYYELPQLLPKDERVAHWRKEGLEHFRQATLLEEVPPWLPNLVAGMMTKEGEQELAIKHLEHVYAVTSDPEARASIEGRLKLLKGQHHARTFARQARRLERLVETRYPYAPEPFSLIVGRRYEPYQPLSRVFADPADDVAPFDMP